MGISVLTRTVLKAYWIFTILFILLFLTDNLNKKIRYIILFLVGYFSILIPYHTRNYIQFKTPSPIEFHQGIALYWSIIPLTKNTDYKPLYEKYPKIVQILQFPPYKGGVPNEIKVKKELNINDAELSKYLTLITLYTIKEKPLSFLKIYIKNMINLITSPSSYIMTIEIFKNGYFDRQHEIIKKLIADYKEINSKEFRIIIPNLIFRVLNLIIFILFLISIMFFIKKEPIKKEINIFLIILTSYILLVTSLTPAYDRYRLPIEQIIYFYISILIAYFLNRIPKIESNP